MVPYCTGLPSTQKSDPGRPPEQSNRKQNLSLKARRNNPRHPPAGVAGRPILPPSKFEEKASSQNKTVKKTRRVRGVFTGLLKSRYACMAVTRRVPMFDKSSEFRQKLKRSTPERHKPLTRRGYACLAECLPVRRKRITNHATPQRTRR